MRRGYTPLHYAIASNADKTEKVLDRYHANSAAKSEKGYTALHIAVAHIAYSEERCRVAYRMLRRLHNSYNLKNDQGDTPLHLVVLYCSGENKDIGRIKELIGYLCHLHDVKHDVNAKNNKGDTPLHLAAEKNKDLAVDVLIKYSADVNLKAKNNEGKTPGQIAEDKGFSRHRTLISSE